MRCFIRTGPCTTVLVQLSGDPKTKHPSLEGTYAQRSGGTTNGREDWISPDGINAIWWNSGTDKWLVGPLMWRGSGSALLSTTT